MPPRVEADGETLEGVYFAHDTVWRFFKKNRKPR